MKKSKLIFLLCLFSLLAAASCQTEILNENLVEMQSDGHVYITLPSYASGLKDTENYLMGMQGIYFNNIIYKGKWRPIKNIVSFDSFDYFSNTESFKQHEVMRKYLQYRQYNTSNFLVDENYAYLYSSEDGTAELRVLGDVKHFEYLGPLFARYNDTIYCSGNSIPEIDLQSLSTIMYPTVENIHGFVFIVFDKDNIYLNCDPATPEKLDEWDISEKRFREKYSALDRYR